MRLIVRYASELLGVRYPNNDYVLLHDMGYGVWREDVAGLAYMAENAAGEWEKRIHDAASGEEGWRVARAALRWRMNVCRPKGVADCLGSVGQAVVHLREHGRLPEELSICESTALDSQKRFLGAPNGVIDLHTGELLTGAAARETLTTRMTRDAYNPDARHRFVENISFLQMSAKVSYSAMTFYHYLACAFPPHIPATQSFAILSSHQRVEGSARLVYPSTTLVVLVGGCPCRT